MGGFADCLSRNLVACKVRVVDAGLHEAGFVHALCTATTPVLSITQAYVVCVHTLHTISVTEATLYVRLTGVQLESPMSDIQEPSLLFWDPRSPPHPLCIGHGCQRPHMFHMLHFACQTCKTAISVQQCHQGLQLALHLLSRSLMPRCRAGRKGTGSCAFVWKAQKGHLQHAKPAF